MSPHNDRRSLRLGGLRAYSRVRALVKASIRLMTRPAALRFISRYVKPNDLVFDIGANMGEKTALYLSIGARVVAVEPQAECVRCLKRRFRAWPRVEIVHVALGAQSGQGGLRVSLVRSPLSSMSEDWIAAVKASGRFSRYEWGPVVTTPVITLDELIRRFGRPDFCKIDVEGYEYEVLRGLSRPLPNLSFEFHVERLPDALRCLHYLGRLGDYEFNYALGNRTRPESEGALSAEEMATILKAFPHRTLQGDVYARLRS